jgi:Mce-associated membrane protein
VTEGESTASAAEPGAAGRLTSPESTASAAEPGAAGRLTSPETARPPRRRASRAAGPHGGEAAVGRVSVETVADPIKRPNTPIGPPPRRSANGRLVGWIALAVSLIGIAILAGGVGFEIYQQRQADAVQARKQRFVDTATQVVVNMFSYNQDNVDQSVARFVEGTSGPLHNMLITNNNVENIKALYRHTDSTSEAVVNGAALESIDDVSDNASVLVSIRVTVTSRDGVNKPSEPYRMRVIVHEDDNGRMTGDDLKWPNGGD